MEKTTQQEATIEQAKKLGIREHEFEMIKEILERTPSSVEVHIYSELWSEECSNKNSIQWLNKLPKVNENIIELGDGLGCSAKRCVYHRYSTNCSFGCVLFWKY